MGKDLWVNVEKAVQMFWGNLSDESYQPFEVGLKSELAQAQAEKGAVFDSTDQDLVELSLQLALYCKKAGVYPFYTTSLAASAIYFDAVKNAQVGNAIVLNGIRVVVEDMYGLSFEPELTYMIRKAYEKILADSLFDIDNKKISLLKKAYELGFYNEATFHGCAQCTIKAFFETVSKKGEQQEFLLKAASSMSGGIACCCDSACGAYSGCILIIGSYVGRELSDMGKADGKTVEQSNILGQRIHDEFEDVYGSNICGEIHIEKFGQRYDFRDEAQAIAFHDAGAHDDKCPATVGLATSWVASALYDEDLL
jgi:C_GCAxxG_C_C family probable redox protein